jgi:predicted phosphodiesterase
MVKIQIVSDTHLEFRGDNFQKLIKPSAPILLLLGDICACGNLDDYEIYKKFITFLSTKFKFIFHVPGNHEYYTVGNKNITIDDTINGIDNKLRKFTSELKNVFFLNNNTVRLKIDKKVYVFIGSTLWTYINPSDRKNIALMMNDYKYIYMEPKTSSTLKSPILKASSSTLKDPTLKSPILKASSSTLKDPTLKSPILKASSTTLKSPTLKAPTLKASSTILKESPLLSIDSDNTHTSTQILNTIKPRRFNTEDMSEMHLKSVKYIIDEMKTIKPTEIAILLTHHKPIKDTVSSDPISQAYESDLKDVIIKAPFKLAGFGHTHVHYDKIINGVAVISNPKGYISQKTKFNDAHSIEIY